MPGTWFYSKLKFSLEILKRLRLDFWKRSSKIRENFLSDPQLNMIDILDYGVTMDLQKKYFLKPAKSYPN